MLAICETPSPCRSTAPRPLNERLDAFRRLAGQLVLPYPDHRPTSCSKKGIRLSIALDIPGQLRGPPLSVRLGSGCVLWTSMPEAAVHKDGDSRAAEDDVRSAPNLGYRPAMNGVPEAQSVQPTPKQELRQSVARCLPAHSLARRTHSTNRSEDADYAVRCTASSARS